MRRCWGLRVGFAHSLRMLSTHFAGVLLRELCAHSRGGFCCCLLPSEQLSCHCWLWGGVGEKRWCSPTVLALGAVLGVLAAPSGHHVPSSSISAQVKGSQDGTGPSCVTPRAAGSAAGPQAPLEMNLCWNEIKKKSHSLR